jgi:PKD repeat protein
MKHLLSTTIILIVLFFIPKMVFGSVVINEVFYDPSETDTGLEYIILYNNGDGPYSLTNHCLYASSEHYIFGSFTLNAKEKVIIHWNADGINTSIDVYTGKTGWSNMGNNSGSIALFLSHDSHNSSNILDFIEYVKKETWESAAIDAGIWATDTFIPNISTPGKVIKLQTDGVDNNSPSDWIETNPSIIQETTPPSEEPEESTPEEPEIPTTPTKNNNPPVADAGDNIIGFVNQEIILDGSFSYDQDENELQYSWNTGDGNSSDHQIVSHKYQYPGTYLATLTVYDGRHYVSDTITIKIQTAQIIINEFMANPSGKDEEEEWIEIYNDADSITDISGWQLDDIASGSKAFAFPKNTLIAPKSYLVFSRQTKTL